MDKKEIMEKIKNIQKADGNVEIFIHHRPPEEFGDAVKLHFENEAFYVKIFDPDTQEVFSENKLVDESEVYRFISNALEPNNKNTHKNNDYIDLDRTEPKGTLGTS